jgi:hypothetical protein
MSKSCSVFLVSLSEKLPKSVFRRISVLIRHLQSEPHTIRCALIEAIGNIIAHHLMFEEGDSAKKQMDHFFDILEERFRDINSYVRAKVLQVCGYLCELKAMPLRRRSDIVELVLGRLRDKSSYVRKKAIQNLIMFIRTHPFSKDGGELKHSFFCKRLEELTQKLKMFSTLPTSFMASNSIADTTYIVPKNSLNMEESLEEKEEGGNDVTGFYDTNDTVAGKSIKEVHPSSLERTASPLLQVRSSVFF